MSLQEAAKNVCILNSSAPEFVPRAKVWTSSASGDEDEDAWQICRCIQDTKQQWSSCRSCDFDLQIHWLQRPFKM